MIANSPTVNFVTVFIFTEKKGRTHMKKLLFLSSAFIMTSLGAHAADLVEGAITGGANTCTVDVLKVSENNATANTIATWSLNEYECDAGQYLLNSDGTLECTECPVGSYCPGGKFTVESENNGANACPTDYTSDAGAAGENECYMGCEVACTQQTCPEHSNNCTHGDFKTTGKQYTNNTCNAYPTLCPIEDLTCDTGYTKTFIDAAHINDVTSGWFHFIHIYCPLDGDISDKTGTNNYCNKGVVPGEAVISKDTRDIAVKYVFSVNNYGPNTNGTQIVDVENITYTILPNADFTPGIHNGQHIWFRPDEILLSTPVIHLFTDAMEELAFDDGLSDSTMKRILTETTEAELALFQQAMGELNNGGDLEYIAFQVYSQLSNSVRTNVPWVYLGEYDEEIFNGGFMENIIETIRFGQISPDSGAYHCANNIINIKWNPDNGNSAIENMCLYDGGIDIPSDPVKPGYTFTGWKLVE